jgi:glycopeptide antibiotics resistance protein
MSGGEMRRRRISGLNLRPGMTGWKFNMAVMFYWAWVLVYTSFLAMASLSKESAPQAFIFQDKVMHLGAYGALTFFFLAAANRSYLPKKETLALEYSFIVGFFLECIQYFLPYRTFDLSDIIANVLGIWLGLCVWRRLVKS